MTFENLQNNFANATALVIDRTFTPPRVLGQAFLISKSRAVTCASAIFNYVEAPWSLAISFVHPSLVYGVKTITLHTEFDKNAARTKYISQTGWPGESLPAQLNDLATIVLDSDLPALQLEKVAQLHKALTLPFSNSGVDVSGILSADDFLPLINKLVESKNSGMLTLFDALNFPIGRIQFDNGEIIKVHYCDTTNELAFSELLFRKPMHGFSFQAQTSNRWAALEDISVTTQVLINEAIRRANELPSILASLGGKDARYQRVVQQFDFSGANPETRTLLEVLWQVLDGYVTLDHLAQILGIDTYLVTQGLKELINFGIVSLLNRTSPFSCSGQLGLPLISHMDFDINPGDALLGFYLDPISGAPTWRQGNFAGVASVLQPKNLLHTIELPDNMRGALILKDYKLIGVHSGPSLTKQGQEANLKQYQMMWIGALLDMTTKKLRATESAEEASAGSTFSGLRSLSIEDESPATVKKIEKHICPSCFATNAQPGACFNCGTVIEEPVVLSEPTDLLGKIALLLDNLQKKYGLTRRRLIAAVVLVIGLPLMAFTIFHHKESHPVQNQISSASVPVPKVEHASSPKAINLASLYTGFPEMPPPNYWYEDTQALTGSTKSFGLKSKIGNQNIVFLLFDDPATLQNLNSFAARPPLCGLTGAISVDKIADGTMVLAEGNLNWFVGRYKGEKVESTTALKGTRPPIEEDNSPVPQTPIKTMFLGSFPGKVSNSAILVIGQALNYSSPYDYKLTLWLIDYMTKCAANESSKLAQSNNNQGQETQDKSKSNSAFASEAEVDAYCKKIQEQLQSKFSIPSEIQEEINRKKLKKPKVALSLDIDSDGQLKKIEITEPGETEKVTNLLVKDVNACVPFEHVPKTKEGTVSVLIMLKKDQITVELP